MKIGNLTISSSGEGNTNTQDNITEQQQGYDSGNDSEKKVGPWKRLDVETEEPVQPQKQPEPQLPPTKPSEPSSNVYIPPIRLRGQQQQQPQQPLQPSRLRSKVAPDIHNEEYFPTLAGSKSDRR